MSDNITQIEYMKDPQDVNRPGAPAYPVLNKDGEPYGIGIGELLSLLGQNDGTVEGLASEKKVEAEVFEAVTSLLRRRWFDGARQAEDLFFDVFPRSADQIRKQISHLEGQLATIAGEPLDLEYHDCPDGGAILEYSPAVSQYGFRHWYPTTEKAKAALLKMVRQDGGTLSPDGLHGDMTPPAAQYSTTAWITRRG